MLCTRSDTKRRKHFNLHTPGNAFSQIEQKTILSPSLRRNISFGEELCISHLHNTSHFIF